MFLQLSLPLGASALRRGFSPSPARCWLLPVIGLASRLLSQHRPQHTLGIADEQPDQPHEEPEDDHGEAEPRGSRVYLEELPAFLHVQSHDRLAT